MRRAGITQEQVAAAAGVTRTHICHVLAGHFISARVVETVQRLIEEADHAAA